MCEKTIVIVLFWSMFFQFRCSRKSGQNRVDAIEKDCETPNIIQIVHVLDDFNFNL